MIVIAGDSWGCGEWDGHGNLLHAGLEQHFIDHNQSVVNLSVSNSSNHEICLSIKEFLTQNRHRAFDIQRFFVFQTEWTRDHEFITDDDQQFLSTAHSLRNRLLDRFYRTLSNIGNDYQINFEVIGGCGDVMQTQDFNQIYTQVSVACPSMTALLINQTLPSVYSVWSVRSAPLAQMLKKNIKDTNEFDLFLTDIESGKQRFQLWDRYKEWFWPDGGHANRYGHKILFDHLTSHDTV